MAGPWMDHSHPRSQLAFAVEHEPAAVVFDAARLNLVHRTLIVSLMFFSSRSPEVAAFELLGRSRQVEDVRSPRLALLLRPHL